MKKIKIMIYLSIILCFIKFINAQNGDPVTMAWLFTFNNAIPNSTCTVQIIPVSFIMNGNLEYNLYAKYRYDYTWGNDHIKYDYIASVYLHNGSLKTSTTLSPSTQMSWGTWFDGNGNTPVGGSPYGTIGIGIYKIIFDWGSGRDTLWLDIDAGPWTWSGAGITLVSNTGDYYGGTSGPGLVFLVGYPNPC